VQKSAYACSVELRDVGADARNDRQCFDSSNLFNGAPRASAACLPTRSAEGLDPRERRFGLAAAAAVAAIRRAEKPRGDELSSGRKGRKKIVDELPKRKKISTRASLSRRNRAARDEN